MKEKIAALRLQAISAVHQLSALSNEPEGREALKEIHEFIAMVEPHLADAPHVHEGVAA